MSKIDNSNNNNNAAILNMDMKATIGRKPNPV
jgi:hypothetical protein